MAVSTETLLKAIDAIAAIDGLAMDPADLAQDVFLLAQIYDDEDSFASAVKRTAVAFAKLFNGAVSVSELERDYGGWMCYHYQPTIGQGQKACLRVVFRRVGTGIDCMGFGHRYEPEDIYRRLARRLRRHG